ncbi:MAG TPA: RecQ family ATP-dependent DNA helicase [Bacteroidota bacterium]|nr:RecQ family ATP-dependent DNA helicase [Bacteroidota bacterium]
MNTGKHASAIPSDHQHDRDNAAERTPGPGPETLHDSTELWRPARALALLRAGTGIDTAEFRDGQEEAIRHVVRGEGRLLVLRGTGWGKSFVYFIATKLLREADFGPTLLISPLLALMRNQLLAAERMGLRAVTINSDNADEWSVIEARLLADDVDVLLISPERLANERFRVEVLAHIAARISLLVVDEAHCISDWGHDFRPHYRLIERIIRTLPANLRLLATTATANNRVMEDLASVLGPRLTVSRGDLHRPSLTLQTLRLPDQARRMAWLAETLPHLDGHGIIYTLTVHDAEQLAEWLRTRGLHVEAYTGATGPRRAELENALLENRVKALVATTALGMGFDKPDISFVLHYQMPGSVVAYYQQVGRAGRAVDAAYGVLLAGSEDDAINEYFIGNAFPTREEVRLLLDALEEHPHGLSVPELLAHINVGKARIERTLALLTLESPAPIARAGSCWQLTAAPLSASFWQRAERLTALRRAEHGEMRRYVDTPFGEHMAFLLEALDGDVASVSAPTLPPLPDTVSEDVLRAATEFIRAGNHPIAVRSRWPVGGLPHIKQGGVIPEALRMQRGRALSRWGDAGWGDMVRRGKYLDGHFHDDLVAAAVRMLRSWDPQPAPVWVTAVPSLRHPELVPDYAKRLARALSLPYYAVLQRSAMRPEQKSMVNSTQQARNVDGSLALCVDSLPHGPVLLVDDMVDSRWTMTLCAWLLRSHGCAEVWPFALSLTGYDS